MIFDMVIKFLLNSTVGTSTFRPLNELIENAIQNALHPTRTLVASDILQKTLISSEISVNSTTSQVVASFVAPASGTVNLTFNYKYGLTASTAISGGRIGIGTSSTPVSADNFSTSMQTTFSANLVQTSYHTTSGNVNVVKDQMYYIHFVCNYPSEVGALVNTLYCNSCTLNYTETNDNLPMVKSIQRGTATAKSANDYTLEAAIETVNPDKCIVLIDGSIRLGSSGDYYAVLPYLDSITANKITFSYLGSYSGTIGWQLIEFY